MNLEKEIYNKLMARDESGLSLLYENYVDALYGMAYRILNHEAHAEDAIQKSFLKIWNSIGQYDSEKSTLFTWMATIVKNTSIDMTRLVSFQKEKKSETFDINVHKAGTDQIDESKMDTLTIIDGLDSKYAIILDYLYLRGYSQRELSDELGIPIGTIKTRVKKAIDILRKKYATDKNLMISIVLIVLALLTII